MIRGPLRYLPFVLGTCVVLPLVGSLLLSQVALQRESARSAVLEQLEAVAEEVSVILGDGIASLQQTAPAGIAANSRWHSWSLDTNDLSTVVGRADWQIPADTLNRNLPGQSAAHGSFLVLGPFATVAGANAVVIATQSASGHWQGVTALVDKVLLATRARRFVQAGNRLQVADTVSGRSIFATDEGDVPSPVLRTISVAHNSWTLRAAPRAGWSAPLGLLSNSVLIWLAALIWLAHEVRRNRQIDTLREDFESADARRKNINTLYGQSLQSLAELESRLNVVSMYDSVTGLANRVSLLRRIEASLDALRQSGTGHLGLLSIGLEQFRYISNTFGAEFASRLLVIAAERLEYVLPTKDLLFRTGDFQLAIVLPSSSGQGSETLAREVIAELEPPIALDNHTFLLRPRVGIVEVSSGYEFAESLLDQANTALSLAQSESDSSICLFDSSTVKDSVSRLQLEADLSKALNDSQFELEYQPVVGTTSRELMGFEALIRWNHPTEGRISPSVFVPIAERSGMAARLNQWVMRETARQASAWRSAGYSSFYINVNLTAGAFQSPDLADDMAQLLAEFELDGRYIQVELTESALIVDLRAAARTVQKLSELGVRSWLDDFGTGYSSLSYLRTLPLRGVKIDQSFLKRIVVDAQDFGFLKSLIELLHYLNLETVVEGVETSEQHELLSLTACSYCQGYFFSRSLPASKAEGWLRDAQRALPTAVRA